jgi:hypothetical protein
MIRNRKPIASEKFLWLKLALLVIGFVAVIQLIQWLREPASVSGMDQLGEPIRAKVIFNYQKTAVGVSN